MRKNLESLLFKSGLSGYRIAKDSGVPQSTVSRFLTKEAELDNISLLNAEKLNEYYKEAVMKLDDLQKVVKEGIYLSEHNDRFYAEFVEDNGDEHRLAEADNIKNLHKQLKQFSQIKEGI